MSDKLRKKEMVKKHETWNKKCILIIFILISLGWVIMYETN